MKKPAYPKAEARNPKWESHLSTGLSSVLISVDLDLDWYGRSSGKRGRSQTFSDAAIEFCLTIGCILDVPLRRAIEITKTLFKATNLNWKVPDYSTVSRRTTAQSLVIKELPHHGQLHMLVDNAGIAILGRSDEETRKLVNYKGQSYRVRLEVKDKE